MCEQNRLHSQCKECGGSAACEHNRRRVRSKECGGSAVCELEHKRERSQCEECGGGCMREDKRQRSQCKDCGGASICEHKRQRSQCKECRGASQEKAQPVQAQGVWRWLHMRAQASSQPPLQGVHVRAGGSAVCEHKRLRGRCKECRGGSICDGRGPYNTVYETRAPAGRQALGLARPGPRH